MDTALDGAAGWWLEHVVCDTEKDTVSFTLHEKQLVGRQLLHTSDSRRAIVRFTGVVAYLVADESNPLGTDYDERDDGYLHVYSKSRFLDFMNHSTGRAFFDSFPEPSKHYCVATSDHIVYVMATEEPQVEIVR
jgi:hypothetical protein